VKLWIARHGDAGKYSTDPDIERSRPLTPVGKKTVDLVAQRLRAMGEMPRVILASPLSRTMESADILGAALGCRVDTEDCLQPNRPLVSWLLDLIDDDDYSRVMIVGHTDNITPAMTTLAEDGRFDPLCKGECRRYKIDRKGGDWEEKLRVRPSDVGMPNIK
jgi:phosphohistidine phosphatase